jgi:hypothetical protein
MSDVMAGIISKGIGRVALVVLLAAGAIVAPPPAPASAAIYGETMFFPIIGETSYRDTFGACRGSGCSRSHQGVDMMAPKMTVIVAVADGTVGWMHNEQGGKCCAMALRHDDGWESWYIHMNNDTPGTDDGQGWGFAPGIERGTWVRAGQHIGWVGDSGNAENTAPHLHFELHQPDGTVVNPTPHVDAAIKLDAPIGEDDPPWEPPPPPPPDYEGTFSDDDTSVHRNNIEIIAELGITRGCNPPDNDMFCPERALSRGEMTAFLRRLLSLPAADTDYFDDDGSSIFEDDINALAAAGIGFGCTETDYCPDAELLREEMAELMVRTFGYTNPDGTDFFTDDEDSAFEESINKLRNAGMTMGCNPPTGDMFCPTRSLTRGEMATFLARALSLGT